MNQYLVELDDIPDQRHMYPEEAFRSWEQMRTGHEEELGDMVAAQVNRLVDDNPQPKILDIGCGEGYTKQLLESRLPQACIVGADFDAAALHADRWLPIDEATPRLATDAGKLPFRTNAFDLVTSISGLTAMDPEHDLPGVAAEIARVLKPSGKLLMLNDTPRGSGYILNAPISDVQYEADEVLVVADDVQGELSEMVVVNRQAFEAQVQAQTSKLGIENFTYGDYVDLVESVGTESVIAPIAAQAARAVLVEGMGYRPLEMFDNGGSWNQRFFDDTCDVLRPYFRFRSETDRRHKQVAPVEITNPDGLNIYAQRMQRDSIGNVYMRDLSTAKPVATQADITARFVIGTKR